MSFYANHVITIETTTVFINLGNNLFCNYFTQIREEKITSPDQNSCKSTNNYVTTIFVPNGYKYLPDTFRCFIKCELFIGVIGCHIHFDATFLFKSTA